MIGHAVTLRLEDLLAGENRVASSISERCADATRCSPPGQKAVGQDDFTGGLTHKTTYWGCG